MQVKSYKIEEKNFLSPHGAVGDDAAGRAAGNADLVKFVQGRAVAAGGDDRELSSLMPLQPRNE